jgi:hypothetical protein
MPAKYLWGVLAAFLAAVAVAKPSGGQTSTSAQITLAHRATLPYTPLSAACTQNAGSPVAVPLHIGVSCEIPTAGSVGTATGEALITLGGGPTLGVFSELDLDNGAQGSLIEPGFLNGIGMLSNTSYHDVLRTSAGSTARIDVAFEGRLGYQFKAGSFNQQMFAPEAFFGLLTPNLFEEALDPIGWDRYAWFHLNSLTLKQGSRTRCYGFGISGCTEQHLFEGTASVSDSMFDGDVHVARPVVWGGPIGSDPNAPATADVATISGTIHFVNLPFLNGEFPFTLGLSAFPTVYNFTGSPQAGWGNVFSDFLHTAAITKVQVFDDRGFDITRTVELSLASGALVPTSTVPEPTSVFLLGTGLLGVGVAARRRRKDADDC